MKRDVYQEVTDKIIAKLETCGANWLKPWSSPEGAYRNAYSNRAYNGINRLLLGFSGYSDPRWATFNQFKKAGGMVRKGEKGTQIVLFKRVEKLDIKGDVESSFAFAKFFTVFNAEQVDKHGLPVAEEIDTSFDPIPAATVYFSEIEKEIKVGHGGSRAFYNPGGDRIQMPPAETFKTNVDYYSTLAHENVHATGHEKRLDRKLNRGRFGNEAYAFEELVAEIGAAFTCAKLGLSIEPREDHAQYINNWLKVLKNDKRAVITAASQAQAASDLMDEYATPADAEMAA